MSCSRLALASALLLAGCAWRQKPPPEPEYTTAENDPWLAERTGSAAASAGSDDAKKNDGAKAEPITTAAEGKNLLPIARTEVPKFITVAATRVYWSTGGGDVASAATNGRGQVLIHHYGDEEGALAGVITTDGKSIYFATLSGIYRIADANSMSELYVAIDDALSVAVDDRYLYFTRFGKRGIWKLAKTGGRPERIAQSKLPTSLTPDGDYLYWCSYGDSTINRIHRETGRRELIARAKNPTGLAVTSDTLFWGTEKDGAVYRKSLSGGPASRIATGEKNHDVFTSLGEHVYWVGWDDEAVGHLSRASSRGGDVETLVTKLSSPVGVAAIGRFIFIANKGEGTILRTEEPAP